MAASARPNVSGGYDQATKASGIGGLGGLDHRRVVLRAERVGFVVHDLETGFLEQRPAGIGELDAEIVADIDDGDFVADLTAVLELLEHTDRALGVSRGRILEHEEAGILFHQRRSLIGDAGLGELRIVVLGESRRGGEIEAGGVNAADPIGLVHCRQPFHGLDGLGRLGAVIVLDDLDLALAVLELETAALVDLESPQLVRREMRDCRAGREWTGFRTDHADLDGGGVSSCRPVADRSGQRRCGGIFQKLSSSHELLPGEW